MEERCRKRRRRNVVVNAEEEERGAETHTHIQSPKYIMQMIRGNNAGMHEFSLFPLLLRVWLERTGIAPPPSPNQCSVLLHHGGLCRQ